MKKKIILPLFILLLVIIFCGCTLIESKNIKSDDSKYYSITDFDSIIIDKSTFNDVYEIAPSSSMLVTSFGGICNYPTSNEKIITIKFYGPELIVGSIEIVN